jgi:hypothetical protein
MTDKLNRLLKEWSSHTAADDEALNGLERKVALKMRETNYAASVALQDVKGFSLWGRFAWFSLGATAAFVVALTLVRLPIAPDPVPAPELARSSASVRHMFDEVNRLFAGNLKWIAQFGGAVELGISPDKDESACDREPFAVHIAVVSRAGGDAPWKKVWETDILTRSEQTIEIALNKDRNDLIGLWIYSVDEGRFAVDSRLSMNVPVRIYSDSCDVVEDGKPTVISVITVGSREYRVYQTVTRLRENAGSVHSQQRIEQKTAKDAKMNEVGPC